MPANQSYYWEAIEHNIPNQLIDLASLSSDWSAGRAGHQSADWIANIFHHQMVEIAFNQLNYQLVDLTSHQLIGQQVEQALNQLLGQLDDLATLNDQLNDPLVEHSNS